MREGTTGSATVTVAASPETVYDTISDVRRIPEWSPECVHAHWIGEVDGPSEGDRFLARNRRGLLRWGNKPTVTAADRPHHFAFVINQPPFGDLTRWSYRIEPGEEPGTSEVTETFELVRDQPKINAWVVRLLGGVADREQDLQRNLDTSLERLRTVVEASGPTGRRDAP
jgi:uncharacterized protein YndB with AHSA1/START domain